ncbi:RNA-binding protein 5 [Adelges cooleyi]|uniref:RNA-binding protein 5 n=1 Tax=Adelges cooleyi TaxID=133065 RepID=UPI00217FA8F8|nr:RNA-binding protein 5 [Adelges cooleyi]XP_050422172.1 RNA-binding protein 5 [Adelges cooleyi]XP_050422173.1 RNA-binding protein 5 [Adelges cooleyi]
MEGFVVKDTCGYDSTDDVSPSARRSVEMDLVAYDSSPRSNGSYRSTNNEYESTGNKGNYCRNNGGTFSDTDRGRERGRSGDYNQKSRRDRSSSRHRSRRRSKHKKHHRSRSRSRSKSRSPRRRGRYSPGDRDSQTSQYSSDEERRKRRSRSAEGSEGHKVRNIYSEQSSSSRRYYDTADTRRHQDSSQEYYREEDFDRYTFKKQIPNKTIIIRGLAPHISENDIRKEILKCGLTPVDIRLIRKKDTGSSRGFAFVEFFTKAEAETLMESKQGEMMLRDNFRAIMQYTISKIDPEKMLTDWWCKCNAHNFKRRESCFVCGASRETGEIFDHSKEVSSFPTHTVLLRGLDILTTEENVLKAIQTLSTLPIRSVRIGRNPVTNVSKGICYLEMNNVVDAMYLHNALVVEDPLLIDGKEVLVSYCKLTPVGPVATASMGNAAVEAAKWSNQKPDTPGYSPADIPKLAEYSANMYAKTPAERASYTQYYTNYYMDKIQKGESISLPNMSATPPAAMTAGAVVMPQVVPTMTAAKPNVPLSQPPSGKGETTYPPPDVSTYQYDSTSGYYYDPYTKLYYDANSQYYFNPSTNNFVYWDGTRKTYLLAPTNNKDGAAAVAGAETAKEETTASEEKPKDDDKVKVAKRIAKDMEKWAKTLNQKKITAKQSMVSPQVASQAARMQAAADIGYTVMGSKAADKRSFAATVAAPAPPEDASDNDNDVMEEANRDEDEQHTDWNKLACLLCKRQFGSKDILIKHQQMSDLHKQNLKNWYKERGLDPDDESMRVSQYRDRAKERRMKYNEPDKPINHLKDKYMKAKEASVDYEQPTKLGIGSDNKGNRLLQKMGWQEGMGLGKTNQGRTTIIEAEGRLANAGLGTRAVGVVPGPRETYKDCVKKMMRYRYNESDP